MVWEEKVSEKFAFTRIWDFVALAAAYICNLGSGFLATDYMSFLQRPCTEG